MCHHLFFLFVVQLILEEPPTKNAKSEELPASDLEVEMSEWNQLPVARNPIDRPPMMSWRQVVKDNTFTCVPEAGWLCSQFEYFNHDAFDGKGCLGCISLAWNPLNEQGDPVEVAIKYSSFGKSTVWHGRWFAFTTPEPGITMHFDFGGRESYADWKWVSSFELGVKVCCVCRYLG